MGPEDQHEQPFDQESYEKWMDSKCSCGPDYFDRYCPRHGTESPQDKWKNESGAVLKKHGAGTL